MKKAMKIVAVLAAAAIVAGSFAACTGSNDSGKARSGADGGSGSATGKVTLSGSTSMQKMVNSLMEAFKEKQPGIAVTAEFTGSGTGIKAAADGAVNIGNSSRALTEEEKASGLVENIVATDGIAVVTDQNNTVKNLTRQQLVDIYTGKVNNWKDVGGKDQRIVVIGRESGSGTRDGFETILGLKEKCKYAQEIDSTGAVMAKAQSTPGAIGYVSLDVVSDAVTVLTVDGVAASESTIQDQTYILQRPFVMATKGEISAQDEATKMFFQYIQSDEGKTVIKNAGLFVD